MPYGVPKETTRTFATRVTMPSPALACARPRRTLSFLELTASRLSPDSPMPAATGTRRPPGSRAQALETTFPLATDGLKGIVVEGSSAAGLPLLETAILVVSFLGNGTSLSERAAEGKQRRSSIKTDGVHTGEHSILPVVSASSPLR